MSGERSRKNQKSAKQDVPTKRTSLDASPRSPNKLLIVASIVLFVVWFGFLSFVAFFR